MHNRIELLLAGIPCTVLHCLTFPSLKPKIKVDYLCNAGLSVPLPIILNNSSFEENSAGEGGAIFGTGLAAFGSSAFLFVTVSSRSLEYVTVSNCQFRENLGERDGAGMSLHGFKATLTDVGMLGNKAKKRGGGMSIGDFGDVTIINTHFRNNSAQSGGGGLAVTTVGVQNSAICKCDNSSFEANEATSGGKQR